MWFTPKRGRAVRITHKACASNEFPPPMQALGKAMQLIALATPRRAGVPKDAGGRLNTGSGIERSGRYDRTLAIAAEARHGRTAGAANRRGKTLGARQIEPLRMILARDPLQVLRRGDQIGRVRAPRGLAAARAVAVSETH